MLKETILWILIGAGTGVLEWLRIKAKLTVGAYLLTHCSFFAAVTTNIAMSAWNHGALSWLLSFLGISISLSLLRPGITWISHPQEKNLLMMHTELRHWIMIVISVLKLIIILT